MQTQPDPIILAPAERSDRAELPASLVECHAVIQTQAKLLGELQAQVADLQERIKLDSRNSSKPPSSDGPGQGNRSQRRASQRKRGAQPGHKGHTRAMLDESGVDRVMDCKPEAVCECGGQVELAGAPQRHQVFEVPLMRAQVDEYRLYSGRCADCGKAHAGVLPAGVSRGQLGPRALSLVGVLGTRYHLTQRKIRNLLDQLMGLSFSVGAISQAHGKVAVALKAPVAQASALLCQAHALWMDETHYPREGFGSHWVWAAVQPLMAVFAIYPSRARYVIHDMIGEKFAGVLTSDRYAGYAFLDPQRRQVCWAHLLRDFNRIGQRQGRAGQIGRKLLGLGFVMFRWRDKGLLVGDKLEGLQRRMHTALQRGAQQGLCTRTAKTCANILNLWPALWTFTTNPALAATNNAAEQALRSLVLKRKISGPTRSLRGDHFLSRGFTVHESCLRQGRDLWQFMHEAVVAAITNTTPPSLMPGPAAAPTG